MQLVAVRNEARKSNISYLVQHLFTNLYVSGVSGSDVELQDLLHVGAHQCIPRWELVLLSPLLCLIILFYLLFCPPPLLCLIILFYFFFCPPPLLCLIVLFYFFFCPPPPAVLDRLILLVLLSPLLCLIVLFYLFFCPPPPCCA